MATDDPPPTSSPGRLALALAAGIFVAAWFASSVLRWMPSMQYAFCSGTRGGLCTLGTLMFGYVYYAALTVPVTSGLLAWGITHLLARRPVGIALGVVLLVVGALFQAFGFTLELGVRLASGQWTITAMVNSALAPLIALGGIAAAWLLWKLRESGRRLAIVVLAVTIGSTLWTAFNYPQGVFQSPMAMLALFLRMALLGYLLGPMGRAAVAAAR